MTRGLSRFYRRNSFTSLLVVLFAFLLGGRNVAAAQICDTAILIFKSDQTALLNPAQVVRKARPGISSAIEELNKAGKCHLLYKASQALTNGTNAARFNAIERVKIVVSGEDGELPELPKIELDLAVRSVEQGAGNLKVSFEGKVRWCPELMNQVFVTSQKAVGKLNESRRLLRTAAGTNGQSGNGLVQLVLTNNTGSGMYQLPVIKEAQFDSSRICKPNELMLNFTVAESGTASPEALLLLLVIRDTL